MNAIATYERITFYIDLPRTARFYRQQVNDAVNDAIREYIDEKMGDDENRNPENFQWVQTVRDELYTIIAEATPLITNGTVITNKYYSTTPSTVAFPTDYYTFVMLLCTIDSYTDYAIPTKYNELGPLFKNSFTHPTNEQFYYNEKSTGITVWRGVGGTFSSAQLTYIKIPTPYNCGYENQLLGASSLLTNTKEYYATEVSVYSGTTYQIGQTITGTGAALTSGQVIAASDTSPIALPEKTQEEIARRASKILLKSIGQPEQAAVIDSASEKM